MKHTHIVLLALLLVLSLPLSAQTKTAVVNTDYILRSLPDYVNAQKRIDKYVEDWQNELAQKTSELDALRVEFEQENYLLPDNLKKRRQEEIKAKEQEIKTLQQQRFGPGGDLDRKRAELLKAVQDRVYTAIERIVQEKNYAFVLDKAGSPAVLYANKKFDISDEVLEALGVVSGTSSSAADSDAGGQSKRPSNSELRRNDNPSRPASSPAAAPKNSKR